MAYSLCVIFVCPLPLGYILSEFNVEAMKIGWMVMWFPILGDSSPKNVEKVTKGFEKGGCLQYKDAVTAEAAKSTAVDFPKLRCIITDNYYVDYSLFMCMLNNKMSIIPLNQIATLYRSNIIFSDSAHYDYFNLTLELKNGIRIPCNRISRNGNNCLTAYDEIIALVKTKISNGKV